MIFLLHDMQSMIMNQTDIRFVHNKKESCRNDYIPLNLRRIYLAGIAIMLLMNHSYAYQFMEVETFSTSVGINVS